MYAGRARGGKVRAPRRGLTKDEVDKDQIWAILDSAFREIHAKNASQLSFEELFRNAYRLVLKKQGDFLFEKVKSLEISILDDNVKPDIVVSAIPCLIHDAGSSSSAERKAASERFMEALKNAFQHHSLCMTMITDVLMYMDRISTSEGKHPSIYAVSMNLFRERILNSRVAPELTTTILDLLETVILDNIAFERSGEQIERSLIRSCCSMLGSLYESFNDDESSRLYLTSFEPKFLAASRDYYSLEGTLLVREADAHTFCEQAKKRLKEEVERCAQTLSQSTETKIRSVVEIELITKHIRDVIALPGTGVSSMLDNEKVDDLRSMFDLVKSVDSRLGPLKEAVHGKIVQLGKDINDAANHAVTERLKPQSKDKSVPDKQINQQTAAAVQWVEDVLKLKRKYDAIWEKAFLCDANMEKSLERSYQDTINANTRAAEYVSLFLDEHLKKNMKGKSEQDLDQALQDGVVLTQYLANKDVLETYYHKHMAKRLLQKKSASRDMERLMLSRLKIKLGNQFTQKMEGLLKDTDLADTLNKQYKDHVKTLDKHDVDIETQVLTLTVWPIKSPEGEGRGCIYPADVETSRQSFERFYLSKHTGRKLTWMANLGDALIRATYNKGGKTRRYEISAPTYCMVILSLFNDHQSLSAADIHEITQIPRDQLNRCLLSLAVAPKTRLLQKVPLSREVADDDVFSINENFESQFTKIKIVLITDSGNKIETPEQRKETKKRTDDERAVVIDAAIVRIMKSRKHLAHNTLMTETINMLQSRFPPDVALIKKRIEGLIEREYLERGSDIAHPSYDYLA